MVTACEGTGKNRGGTATGSARSYTSKRKNDFPDNRRIEVNDG